MLKDYLSAVGAMFLALWVLGSIGLGNFQMYFGPDMSLQCKPTTKGTP